MSSAEQFDVFLAHNSLDKPQVRAIANKLREQGLKPWLDEEQIAAGELFQAAIQSAFPEIKAAAIFIGLTGLGKWQAIELQALISQFVNRGSPVIPVLLPEVDTIPDNLIFLQQFNWVSFKNIDDDFAVYKLECGITGCKPSEYLQNMRNKLKDLTSKKEILEDEIKKIEKRLNVINSLGSEVNFHLRDLLNWLAKGEEIAKKYGSIALKKFPTLQLEIEEKNNLDTFYQDISCYLDFIYVSMETGDKIFLNEPVFLPNFAYFDAYKETFRIIKNNIPDDIEVSIKNKFGEHIDYMLKRLQVNI